MSVYLISDGVTNLDSKTCNLLSSILSTFDILISSITVNKRFIMFYFTKIINMLHLHRLEAVYCWCYGPDTQVDISLLVILDDHHHNCYMGNVEDRLIRLAPLGGAVMSSLLQLSMILLIWRRSSFSSLTFKMSASASSKACSSSTLNCSY